MPQRLDPPPSATAGQDALALPFSGLGLDHAETRRKVRNLRLTAFPLQGPPLALVLPVPPPVSSGYGLLLRLCRETLGS
jgi:hypothetical protein